VTTQPQHHVSAQPLHRPAAPPSRRCHHDLQVCLHPAKYFRGSRTLGDSTTQNNTHNCGRKIKAP